MAEPRESDFAVFWPSIVAGAVLAAGISLTLLTFGSAIGLSVASTAPTWRDSSSVLWFLSGLFLVFVSLTSFGFGGYIAGRMRPHPALLSTKELELSDGLHGIIAWGLAVILGTVLAFAAAAITAPAAVPSNENLGPSASVAGENIIASELDELFHSDRRDVPADITYRRAEAARILLKTSGHTGVTDSDREHLAGLVVAQTGIGDDEASRRVDDAIAKSGQEIHRARQALVIQAFFVAAALVLGAALAWFAASEGGADRLNRAHPVWDWRLSRRRVPTL